MNFKKVASIALAGAMAMSMMAVPAFAAGTGTTTTTTTTSTGTKVDVTAHKYSAYQIFTGTQAGAGQALGNVEWAKGVDSAKLLDELKKDTKEYTTGTTVASKFKDIDSTQEDSAQKVANVLASEPEATKDALARAFAVDVYNSKCLASVTPITLGTEPTNTIKREVTKDGYVTYSGSGISTGYYLIEDTTDTNDSGNTTGENPKNDANNLTVLQVADTITIKPKNEYPTIEKKILDPVEKDVEKDVNEASMGEDVHYELKSTVPDTSAYTEGYYFYMSDQQSKGLTLNKEFVVTVGSGDNVKKLNEGTDYTVTYEEYGKDTINYLDSDTNAEYPTAFEINFKNIQDTTKYTVGQAITVTYTAELNENAAIYPASNPNKVNLHYSNNPNVKYSGRTEGQKPTEPMGETPWDEVRTYTTGVKLQKTDATQQKFIDALKGAEFTLKTKDGMKYSVVTANIFTKAENGTYWKLKDGTYTMTDPTTVADTSKYEDTTTKYSNVTKATVKSSRTDETEIKATVNDEGQITFTGLGAGTYTLSETNTPKGYNTAADVTFTISFTKGSDATKADGYTFTSSDPSKVSFNSATGLFDTTIENHVGNTLPSTGGIGTRMFYVFGGCLVAAAVVLLALKKRREA